MHKTHRARRFRLKAGDCGLVWGAYNFEPPIYEASFLDGSGHMIDTMFIEEDGKEELDLEVTPFPEKMKEVQLILVGSETKT